MELGYKASPTCRVEVVEVRMVASIDVAAQRYKMLIAELRATIVSRQFTKIIGSSSVSSFVTLSNILETSINRTKSMEQVFDKLIVAPLVEKSEFSQKFNRINQSQLNSVHIRFILNIFVLSSHLRLDTLSSLFYS